MEERENYWDDEIVEAVNRFKRSLVSGSTKYFDVSEFEGIVEQLMEEGDMQGSEIAAMQGIKIHPNAVPLHLKYAQVLLNKGLFKKSLKYLELAEKVDVSNPDVHLLKGSASISMGKEAEALASFKKAIQFAGSELDDILYHIGASYVQVGNIKKALYYFEKTVKANPFNDLALYDLGFFYDQEEKLEESIKYYNLYLDIDPWNQYVWFNLGTVFNKTGDHQKAIEAYEFAHTIDDGFYMALFNIGNALANAEKFEEAIVKYNEFLEVEPDNDDAYCYIGECYLNMEKFELSEKYYRWSLELNPNNDTGRFGIGLIRWIEGKHEESIVEIKKAIMLDDLNSEYWLTLGKVNKDFGNKTAAITALRKTVKIDASNTEAWSTWADVYVKFKELDNAIRIIKRGIEKNDDVLLKYRMVALLLQSKRSKDAFVVLEQAMEQDPEHIEYLYFVYPNSAKNKKLIKMVDNFKVKS